jgi:hypothetical protein
MKKVSKLRCFLKRLFPIKARVIIRKIIFVFRFFPEHIDICINYVLHNRDRFEKELIVVTKVKNEASYIKEWIEYHKLVGVEKFIIYDNESEDNLKEILQPYIDSGEVVYIFQPGGFRQFQEDIVTESIKKYRNISKWIAVIDIDEFIVPLKREKITDVIDDIEKIVERKIYSLEIHWVMYGYSGHYSKPEGLVIENYTKSAGINRHVKSIVNPRTVIRYEVHSGFHFFLLQGIEVDDSNTLNLIEHIRINHYYTRSYEDWISKEVRNNKLSKEEYKLPDFDPDFLSDKEDRVMDKYIPLLKNKLLRISPKQSL